MNIIICMKYSSKYDFNDGCNHINPYDMFAIKSAITLKRQFSCVHITALTMAPKSATGMLKKAISLGCDEAVLVTDKIFGGSDTIATSYILYRALKYIGLPQLVMCGEKSIDGETGFVGIALAHRLNFTCITNVVDIEDIRCKSIILQTEDRKYKNKIEVDFPAVLNFRGTLPSLGAFSFHQQILAKQFDPYILTNNELQISDSLCGFEGARTKVIKVEEKKKKREKKEIDSLVIENIDTGIDYIFNELEKNSLQ